LPTELLDCTKFVTASDVRVEDYDRAIIFYYATWSGPTVAVFKWLCRKLESIDVPFDFVLIDADEPEQALDQKAWCKKLEHIFGALPHAYGEVCWVRHGRIIAQDILGAKGMTKGAVERLLDERLQEWC